MPRKPKEPKELPGIDSQEVILKELGNCYTLHPGQVLLDEQIFAGKKKRVFAQCGRNWGKSVSIARITAKFACLNPKSHCYIILPEKTQAKEIYWDTQMLRGMIPDKYIAKNILNRDEEIKTELRIKLTNGSFIKLLGADDPDSLRGIKPHFCAYDEYRDFKEAVYWSMEANLLGKGATLLIGSTPPDILGHYSELRKHFMDEIQRGNEQYYYLELPTETNPHISRDTLMDIKRRLISHGQLRVWEREYMAKLIPGGASAIFPMFAERKEDIVKPNYLINELIKNEKDVLEFYALFDPASSSVFGALLIALNRFESQVYVLKEIYERDRYKTSSIDIWNRANNLKGLYLKKLDKWENFYDEHESWFFRDLERYEILLTEGTNLEPTQKQSRDKQEDLAIIKDLMLLDNRFFISEDCTNLIDEIESYATDKHGKIAKKKDHLLDCLRYFIAVSDFSLIEQPNYEAYIQMKEQSRKMVDGFETFIKHKRKQEDWTSDLDEGSMFRDDEVIHIEDISYAELF